MPKKQERLELQRKITEFNFKNKKSTQLGELEIKPSPTSKNWKNKPFCITHES